MATCPQGHEVDEGQASCPRCGVPVTQTSAEPVPSPQGSYRPLVLAIGVLVLLAAAAFGANAVGRASSTTTTTTFPPPAIGSDEAQYLNALDGPAWKNISNEEKASDIALGHRACSYFDDHPTGGATNAVLGEDALGPDPTHNAALTGKYTSWESFVLSVEEQAVTFLCPQHKSMVPGIEAAREMVPAR